MFSSSDSLLPLPPVTVVTVTDFPGFGRRSSSGCTPGLLPNLLPEALLYGFGVERPVIDVKRLDLRSGLSVAMQPAVIPTPISTVLQIAKSVVR